MGDFKKRGRGDGHRSEGDYRGRGSGRKEMTDAVCDNCGDKCKVPFKPSANKPIYCSKCFGEKSGGDRGGSRVRGGRGGDSSNKLVLDQLSSINHKLEQLIEILAPKPTEEKGE